MDCQPKGGDAQGCRLRATGDFTGKSPPRALPMITAARTGDPTADLPGSGPCR